MARKRNPETFRGPYTFSVSWDSARRMDPGAELVQLVLTDVNDRSYVGTVVTPAFIEKIMEKDRLTGECANGDYFCAPRMIVVRSLDKTCLRLVVDDLSRRGDFEEYFLPTSR